MPWVRIYLPAFDPRLEDARVLDVVNRARKEVTIDHDEVGAFARLERADLLFPEHQVRVVARVELDRLRAREGLLGVELALIPLRLARDRRPHREEGIVEI